MLRKNSVTMLDAPTDEHPKCKCPVLVEFIHSIPSNLLAPYGDARYFDAQHLGCSFETSFHETGNLVNMVFVGSPVEAVARGGQALSPEVHISILKEVWLRGCQSNISAEDIRRIAIGLARDWDYYPSSLFLRAHQTQFKPARKSASRGRCKSAPSIFTQHHVENHGSLLASVNTGTSKCRCPTLVSFIRRLPRHLIIPYDDGGATRHSSDIGNVIRFYEDDSGCSFKIEPRLTDKDAIMIFDGPAGEAVMRSGQTYIPRVQIAISREVWGHIGSQRKLKADDVRDLAVALATEWECTPSALDITSTWDPGSFFGSVAAHNSVRGMLTSYHSLTPPCSWHCFRSQFCRRKLRDNRRSQRIE
jgi:hypothetical protein